VPANKRIYGEPLRFTGQLPLKEIINILIDIQKSKDFDAYREAPKHITLTGKRNMFPQIGPRLIFKNQRTLVLTGKHQSMSHSQGSATCFLRLVFKNQRTLVLTGKHQSMSRSLSVE
jgi:hypothetical protein